jgi:diketogulonate reductase-like aldo/keto reductase
MEKNIPTLTIPGTGARIPAIGLGTFGSDSVDAQAVANAVRYALSIGYRHIDCAAVYQNEKEIGAVLQEAMDAGTMARDQLWITSKLWNDMHGEVDIIPAFMRSLHDLKLDYLDLYLIHWPFPNYHPPKCDVSSRSPNARPYIHADFMKVWRKLESLVDAGLVRHIGTSNMTIPKLELVLRDARIKPAFNEMELHPHFQQPTFVRFVQDSGIIPIGYSPLGSPGRPERDKTMEDTVDMEDPVLVSIARKHGVHPAAICLKWAVANGHIPIPFSASNRNILANLEAVCSDPLLPEEKHLLDGIDRDCRLIKGQVFLWQGANDWHDLWDENGTITT